MKTVSQNDLQHLYSSPTPEQTGAMRSFLSGLPDHKSARNRSGAWKARTTVILLTSLLLVSGIVALAAQNNLWTITWGAKPVEDDLPTAPPGWTDEKEKQMSKLFDSKPDEYYGTVSWMYGDRGIVKEKRKTVYSFDQFLEILDAAGYPHSVPFLPDKVRFAEAVLHYGCCADGEYHLVSRTEADEFICELYSIAPPDEILVGYEVRTWDQDKRWSVYIVSDLRGSPYTEFGFYQDPDEYKVESLSVPGMQEALYVQEKTSDFAILSMLRPLEQPVDFCIAPLARTTDPGSGSKETSSYRYEFLHVSGHSLDEILYFFIKPQEQSSLP